MPRKFEFEFFELQNVALFCNLLADLLSEHPYLPTSPERLILIFLWIFDLIGYHAAEMENVPSSWPDWVAPFFLVTGSIGFFACGLVLVSKLPSDRRGLLSHGSMVNLSHHLLYP